MMQAGVSVTAVRYLGAIHDFVMLNPISDTTAARSAIRLANMNLRIAFAGAGATLGSRRTVGAAAQR
jgi:acetyl esterase